jgi:PAS domain S-box-containing protein
VPTYGLYLSTLVHEFIGIYVRKLSIYYNDWKPFTSYENGNIEGLSADIIKNLASNSNLKLNFIKVDSFSNALYKVNEDKFGAIISTSATKDREKYALFSKPYISFPISIATKSNTENILDLNELNGKKIAVGKNFTAYKLLEKNYPDIQLIPVKNTIEALYLLSKDKVDAAADINPVLVYYITQNNYNEIKITANSKFNVDLQIMVNKENREIIPILNKLIEDINPKTKQNITNKWIYTKQVTKIDYTTIILIIFISIIIISFLIYRQFLLEKYQNKLEDSEFRWKFAIEGSGDGLWDWNLETNNVFYSKQWKKLFGFREDEISSDLKEWHNRINPNQLEYVLKKIEEHIHGITKEYECEYQISCKNNTFKWILDRGVVVKRDSSNNPTRIIGTHKDITKRKELLEEIQLVKNQFENMFKTHDSVMLLISPDTGAILDANLSATNFYGYSYTEFTTMNISQINVSSKDEIQNSINSAKSFKNNKFVFPHKLKNGQIKNVEVYSSPIETQKGIILFSIIKDVTNEKELEKEIVKQINFTSTLIDNANAIIAVIDATGTMFKINKYGQEYVGYSQEEIASAPYFWDKFLPENKRNNVIEIIKKAQKGEIVKSFKNSWLSKTGEEKIFEWSNTLIKKPDGTMDYLATIGIDITQKEKTQELILAQKMEFESIFKFSSDGIAITDLETNFLEFNEAYLNITGFTRDELLQKSSLELTVPELRKHMKSLIKKAITYGHIKNFQKESIVANNRRIALNMSITLLPNQEKLLIIIKDVTTIKILEEQARLASMGEMIGNIAHQWRQPLSIISTVASGIKLSVEIDKKDDEELVKSSDKIIEQTMYLSKTIDDFRNFIKEDKEFKLIFINDIIMESLKLLDSSIKNNYIKIEKEIFDNIEVNGNKNELQQAIINILNNAIDFLKEKIEDQNNRYIFIKTKRIDTNSLELTILDSAGGINEKIIDRIFEPYFTTKHQSIGTGLGLSMVDKILREKHHFEIAAYNEEFTYNSKKYKGACFKVLFKKQDS